MTMDLDTKSEKNEQVVITNDVRNAEPSASVVYDFPEGGLRANLVVLGAALALFATFGVVNAYGVFQDYFETTYLTSSSSSTISLIGALQLFILYGLASVIGKIYDAYGTTILVPAGAVLTTFSLIMVSLCQKNQAWQFFLAQGLLFGIAISLLFNPALAIAGHWFKRKRAYALGVITAGSSLGGVVFPIMLQQLIPRVGFGWAVRIAALVVFVCLIVSSLTMRTRLPLRGTISWSNIIDLGGFRDYRYSLMALCAFLNFYALFTPYFYMELYAEFQGVSPTLSKYLLVLINVAGIPSRIIPGMLADRFGPLNVLVPSTFVSSLLILCLWLPSRGAAAITVFSVLYGLFTGAFVSLIPAYIANISPPEKFGARLGSIYFIVAIASLAGTPTAGAFVNTIDQQHFNNLIIFTGVLIFLGAVVGGILIVLSRRTPAPEKS